MTKPAAPLDAAAILRRTTALLASGPNDGALALLVAAVARFPRDAALAYRHGDALQLAGRLPEAVSEYRRAVALDDTQFDAWYGLGCALLAQRGYGDAITALATAVRLRADAAGARCSLGEALFELGDVDAAITEYRAAAATGSAQVRAAALASIATAIPGSPTTGNDGVLAARLDWMAIAGKGLRALPSRPPARDRKLRIGYVSAFFGARHWMKPVFGVINHHDRDRFEIHLISDGGDPSTEAGYRDHPHDVIWPVRGLPPDELARRIAAAEIDVLVDLNGYSFRDRLACFLQRPAPVQLGWFNHFATSGTSALDALIGDAAAIPEEEEPFYSERIVRVAGSYLAFNVLYPVPPLVPPPCLQSGRLTFGCLGSLYKITGDVIAAWSRILRAAPGTRLLLKSPPLDDPSSRAAIERRFADEGVATERLALEGRDEHYRFLQAYGRVDLALDTFPYNGGTTTTEALWQGVPVVSFNGDRWAARTSRSLLLAAGLGNWVATDQAGYEQLAISLARDSATPSRLAALRAGMRDQLQSSPICDSAGLCLALEAIYIREAEARRSDYAAMRHASRPSTTLP